MFHTVVYPKRKKTNSVNNNFNNVLNHLFHDTVNHLSATSPARTRPAANVKETDTEFFIELAVPGLSKKDIAINIEKDLLSISATKEVTTKEGETLRRNEFNYNEFKRNFRLPDTVDVTNIKANFKNGVLGITLPKKEEAAPRNIEIA